MSANKKLTKKQKKAVAFRERKTGKRKGDDGIMEMEMEDNSVPVMEDQILASMSGSGVEVDDVAAEASKSGEGSKKTGSGKGKGKSKAGEGGLEDAAAKSKKRKRDSEVADVEDSALGKKTKSSKRKKSDKVESSKDDDSEKDKTSMKQRFILFVGNLKYTTTKEAIEAHFAACDPPPTIRLLTQKNATGPRQNKSKGCAFLEFSHRNALQQGLKLHQTTLEDRMINVELTAGGGGKGENRLAKVKERNKSLFAERKQRIEKNDTAGETIPTLTQKPQRYSATSGIEQTPSTRRTWTVGDADDGLTHRGGQRHTKGSKSRKPRTADWATGVNAIPVG
ncbi:hypothetical protein BDQ12DRAFT_686073 [Crucibulum laeve]|uniref:RRM domain-containing protein n=1 Tax=Crucibulum laeve TaxID=68775 RepID=A0A5C3LUR1_9AGAR|nr:hypothetical protein BDQ12DRAFT_686073 [Crucibulum laeve]